MKYLFKTIFAISFALFLVCSIISVKADIKNFDDIFYNHGTIMLLIDAKNGSIVDANNSAARFYGYTIEGLQRMKIQDINTLSREEVEQERKNAQEEKRNYFIFKHRLANGEIRTVEVYSWPVARDKSVLFSIIHDITLRVEAEKEIEESNIRLKRAEGVADVGHWEFHLTEGKVIASDGAKKLYGLNDEEWEIKDVQKIPLPEYRQQLDKELKDLIEGKGKYDIEFKIKRPTDNKILHIYSNAEYDAEKNVVFGVIHDITKQKLAEETLENQKRTIFYSLVISSSLFIVIIIMLIVNISDQKKARMFVEEERGRLKDTLYSIGVGFISTDKRGRVDMINAVAEELTGCLREEALGKEHNEVFRIINENEEIDNSVDEALKLDNLTEYKNDVILCSNEGVKKNIVVNIEPIRNVNSTPDGVAIIFRDVTEEKQYLKTIKYLSYHDQLTELYNRRFFEEEILRLNIERNLPISILIADVNGLKLVNDAFGHEIGDKLLKATAKVIKTSCRSDEIVARWGGDEFIVLLPKTSFFAAEEIAKRIKKATEQVVINSIPLSISLGWETKNTAEEKMEEVFKKAEDYMYRRKLFESPSMRGKTIQIVMKTLYERNKREEQHSQRVGELCKNIGLKLGLNDTEVNELMAVGLLHDIGKIAIEDRILNKEDGLEESEWSEIKRHSEIGYRILNSNKDTAIMSEYILAHHERWDGTGYPKGLKGEEIPFYSRIIAVADAYDAMTSDRTYRKAMSHEKAMKILLKNSGTQFDADVVRIFSGIELPINGNGGGCEIFRYFT